MRKGADCEYTNGNILVVISDTNLA